MDEEREFRLRPRKPPIRSERATWARAFKTVIHHARMTSRNRGRRTVRSRTFHQRCAVRVTYARNTVTGQWRAHGKYIARESANAGLAANSAGFDQSAEGLDVSARLNEWQQAGDERVWKLIISPEFGERMDLRQLTRGLVARMESDLGTRLQWVAVQHHNTDHPHAHVVLRGVKDDGATLVFQPDYVKHRIREVASDLCTRQIGHRSQADAELAQRRELGQFRFTSADRFIKDRLTKMASPVDLVDIDDHGRKRLVPERLRFLASMGLATELNRGQWQIREDFEQVLRAMQLGQDRQRLLAAHGVAVSDARLPISVLDTRQLSAVEGRVLLHGENESTGRSYLLLEGVEGRIHHIYYTQEIEAARRRGALRVNAFVRISRSPNKDRDGFTVEDLGDADKLVKNRQYLRSTAQRQIARGVIPTEDGWGGWLGRYQNAVSKAGCEVPDSSLKENRRQRRDSRAR